MPRQPRQIAGLGADDLKTQSAIDNYMGVPRELIAGSQTLHLMSGNKPGGIRLLPDDGLGNKVLVVPTDGRGSAPLETHIGKTKPVFFPENFGLPASDLADGYTALQAAINAAGAARGECILRRRYYPTSQTLKVPAGAKLHFEGGVLKPTMNNIVLRPSEGSFVDGVGTIDVGDVPNYSQAALEINGDDQIANLTIRGTIQIVNSSGKRTGTGYRLIAGDNARVDYVNAIVGGITGFAVAAHYKASGTGFVNSNYLQLNGIYDCIEGIITEAGIPGTNCDYNFFTGSIQPTGASTRALRLGGQGNQVYMMIWDWHLAADTQTAITFSAGSRNNTVRSPIGPELVEDAGSTHRYTNNVIEDWFSRAPVNRSTLPPSLRFQNFAGTQDDILAYADKHSGWTVTATPALSGGSLAGMFDPNMTSAAVWTTNTPVQVVVDFGATPLEYFLGAGVSFSFGNVASNVKVEISTDGTNWIERKSAKNNGAGQVSFQEDNFYPGVRKLRLTLSNPAATGTIALERFFAWGAVPQGGFAFRPRVTTDPVYLTPVPPDRRPAPVEGQMLLFWDNGEGCMATRLPDGRRVLYQGTIVAP